MVSLVAYPRRLWADQSDADYNNGTISERMVRSVEHYPLETIVLVQAKLRQAAQRVKNATIHDYELDVFEVHKIGNLSEHVPFSVYDAENIHRENEDLDEDEVDDTAILSEESSGTGEPRESKGLGQVSGGYSKCELPLTYTWVQSTVLTTSYSKSRCSTRKNTSITPAASSTEQSDRGS